MEVTLCFSSDQNLYMVYFGSNLVLETKSYHKAKARFDHFIDMALEVKNVRPDNNSVRSE